MRVFPIVHFLSTSPAWGTTLYRFQVAVVGIAFYPRPPRGGRHLRLCARQHAGTLSIHVPRVGDDSGVFARQSCRYPFYPRPPRGGRPPTRTGVTRMFDLSIHVPRVGDDPKDVYGMCVGIALSIHVPRVGDDRCRSGQ